MGSRVTGLGVVGVRGGWDPRVVKSSVVGHRVVGIKGWWGSRGDRGQGDSRVQGW